MSITAMKNCAELYKSGKRITGVNTIDPDGLGAFEVFCDQKSSSGGWTVCRRKNLYYHFLLVLMFHSFVLGVYFLVFH